MSRELVAALLWSLLALSVGLTVIAFALRTWWLLLVAAACSLAFAIPAILSIGPYILLLTGFQVVSATALYRQGHAPGD